MSRGDDQTAPRPRGTVQVPRHRPKRAGRVENDGCGPFHKVEPIWLLTNQRLHCTPLAPLNDPLRGIPYMQTRYCQWNYISCQFRHISLVGGEKGSESLIDQA